MEVDEYLFQISDKIKSERRTDFESVFLAS